METRRNAKIRNKCYQKGKEEKIMNLNGGLEVLLTYVRAGCGRIVFLLLLWVSLRHCLWKILLCVASTLEPRPAGGNREGTSEEWIQPIYSKLTSFSLLLQDHCPQQLQVINRSEHILYWHLSGLRGEMRKEKKRRVSLASGVSRGSWYHAHLKRCVEFIRGYEPLLI